MIEVGMLIQQCAPDVAPDTIRAIIRTESGFDPLALNVNGTARLAGRPKTAEEAVQWSQWLIDRGHSVDMGLMQINSRNLKRLNLTVAEVFQPCQNIKAGAQILTADYQRAAKIHGEGSKALLLAISAYNTGSFERGFRNGYVEKVVKHATGAAVETIDLTCLTAGCEGDSIGSKEAGAARRAPGTDGLLAAITRAVSNTVHRARPVILCLLMIVTTICVHRALKASRTSGA